VVVATHNHCSNITVFLTTPGNWSRHNMLVSAICVEHNSTGQVRGKDEIKVINESVVESETTEELSGFPRI